MNNFKFYVQELKRTFMRSSNHVTIDENLGHEDEQHEYIVPKKASDVKKKREKRRSGKSLENRFFRDRRKQSDSFRRFPETIQKEDRIVSLHDNAPRNGRVAVRPIGSPEKKRRGKKGNIRLGRKADSPDGLKGDGFEVQGFMARCGIKGNVRVDGTRRWLRNRKDAEAYR